VYQIIPDKYGIFYFPFTGKTARKDVTSRTHYFSSDMTPVLKKPLSIAHEGIVFPQLSFICSDAKKSPTQCIIKSGAWLVSHFPASNVQKDSSDN
jgi:hypothetical protein